MGLISEIVKINPEAKDPAHELYGKLQYAKQVTGMGIFATGAILHAFKEFELWKGYADSWKEFCAAEANSYSYAQTTIRLYKKFMVELKLGEDVIEALAKRDYTLLDAASKLINPDNAQEWIPKLKTLGRKDIYKEIRTSSGEPEIRMDIVSRLASAYLNLEYEEKQEFHKKINREGEEESE